MAAQYLNHCYWFSPASVRDLGLLEKFTASHHGLPAFCRFTCSKCQGNCPQGSCFRQDPEYSLPPLSTVTPPVAETSIFLATKTTLELLQHFFFSCPSKALNLVTWGVQSEVAYKTIDKKLRCPGWWKNKPFLGADYYYYYFFNSSFSSSFFLKLWNEILAVLYCQIVYLKTSGSAYQCAPGSVLPK